MKIDKRKITKKAIEANITGKTNSLDYLAEISGVKMLVKYRKERRNDIFCPSTSKDDPEANVIEVFLEDVGSLTGYTEQPDKIIRF